ncbi:MAG: glycosyltransferase, partial [Cyclobacteriaceae bacterium]|nr:glycosyltransferase [Cyclobacteriaceae bacterium]
MFFLKVIEISLFGYFFYVSIYNFILSIAGSFSKKYTKGNSKIIYKVGVFIPAYKEDSVIFQTAKAATLLDYPKKSYDVIVIADSLKTETLENLGKLPIKIIEVEFEQSTKVKALRLAINKFQEQFDFFVILDADNIIKNDFLLQR